MSVPTSDLRYAGTWSVTERYIYGTITTSPLDNKSYVTIQEQPLTGGPDPSVQPSAIWIPMPIFGSGDITDIIAGTGLSGGGSSGAVTLDNAGVLSVDGLTGALTTKTGGWHRNTGQTISTVGAPSTVSVNWSQSSYGDTTTISQNVPNGANFTVNQRGIYLLTLQISYANLGGATLTDRTLRSTVVVTRGAGTSAIVQGNYDFIDNVPTAPATALSTVYQLNVGDQLFFQTTQYLSAGSFTLTGQSAAPNDFDYNTYWTWTLLKPLP